MDIGVEAVLSGIQLPRFCERFGVQPDELESRTLGWTKVVVLSKDRAFLFPRDPRAIPVTRRELDVLIALDGRAFAPRLLERVHDPDISYYEIGVIERVPGVAASTLLVDASLERVQSFLQLAGRVCADIHTVDRQLIPPRLPEEALKPVKVWDKVNDPAHTRDEVRSAQETLPWDWVKSSDVSEKWTNAMLALAHLEPVTRHGDFGLWHVYVVEENATGVIDWSGCRIDWPVYDFNSFGAWTADFHPWPGRLREFRTTMWESYADARQLPSELGQAMNLFYAVAEALNSKAPDAWETEVRSISDEL